MLAILALFVDLPSMKARLGREQDRRHGATSRAFFCRNVGGDSRSNMTTLHAWFSQMSAIRCGSTVYRKPSGSTVNVTRTSEMKENTGHYRHDEKYVGQVIREEDGGCMGEKVRVRGITDY